MKRARTSPPRSSYYKKSKKGVLPLSRKWRLKSTAQPLLFRFSGVSPLLLAVRDLYGRFPGLGASLSLYRGGYYLLVRSGFRQRKRVVRAAGRYGRFLGPGAVRYAFTAEHGRELSRCALQDLGALLQ